VNGYRDISVLRTRETDPFALALVSLVGDLVGKANQITLSSLAEHPILSSARDWYIPLT